MVHGADGVVQCSEDGRRWIFSDCQYSLPLYFIHILFTMQSLGIVRAVFVKTTQKVTVSEEYKRMREILNETMAPIRRRMSVRPGVRMVP